MRVTGEHLSALLDGALPPAEAAAVEAALAADAGLRAEYEALLGADRAARDAFAALLDRPVPLGLARTVGTAPVPQSAAPGPRPPRRAPAWLNIAAGLALALVGAGGGFLAGRGTAPVPARDWVAEIADYHAVYAAQGRHLVEVGAAEAAHIETWLSEQTGVVFRIPDLSASGLSFEGGRLLVAAGKPVGQLMYRDGAGRVVALCFLASALPPTEGAAPRDLGAFDALVWGREGARFILIGPEGYPALPAIAEAAREA